MNFIKPAIDLDAQLALLRSRGLIIPDEDRARHYLRFVGYYRLAGYALPFQVNYNADGTHRFCAGTTLEDILNVYVFDRKLRLAVMDALERIEVAVRALVSQTLSEQHGPHWFMDASHFTSKPWHDRFIERVKTDIGHDPARAKVRSVFIKHYYDKYTEPDLPASWMTFEALSFGSVSQAYTHLTREKQKPIAKALGLDPKILASWLHALSYLRNLAAHHQRLWNRAYTIKPIAAKRYAKDLQNGSRLYAQMVLIQALLSVISPNSGWGRRLSSLLAANPAIPGARLGFPNNWRDRELWRDVTHGPAADERPRS
ncbi:Abi family protein [Alcaligenaceae bacterium]|nr:Abi family protein [Alcaligenaceae bacterium]